MKSEETVNLAEECPDKEIVTQEAESAEPDNNEKKINTDLKENKNLKLQRNKKGKTISDKKMEAKEKRKNVIVERR